MTLVLAMYDYEKELSFNEEPETLNPAPSGIITIADSVITAHGKPTTKLVTSFRKTYEIDINIYQPNFNNDGSLRNYLYIQSKHKCLLSIAGSTLVAQHALNIITTHLGNLRYTYDFTKKKHIIIRHCQQNPLARGYYDDWNPTDSNGLLDADYIHQTVIYSINHIINATANDRAGDLSQINTNFILSLQCPHSKHFKIYQYNLAVAPSGKLTIEGKKIARNDIGIIGMTEKFYSAAKETYLKCIESNTEPKSSMIDFMRWAISEVHKESYEIDYPIVYKHINERHVTKEKFEAPEIE